MLLDGAVDWLTAQLRWFSPREWERFLPRRPFPAGTLLELLVLCRVLRRGRFVSHELVALATELALEQVQSPLFLAGLSRADQAFPYHAYLVALLTEAGVEVPASASKVRAALDASCGDQTSAWRSVQHRLELRYLLDLGGFDTEIPDLIRQSIVAGSPDPLYLRDDESYAITHVIFYATDFAARPMPDGDAHAELCRTLLGVYLATGDLDLAGEFLLCLTALGAEEDAIAEHGWRTLARRQRPDGAIPGPLHDPARWAGLSGDPADAYLFGTCHHTTMVAAMAAAERERHHDR